MARLARVGVLVSWFFVFVAVLPAQAGIECGTEVVRSVPFKYCIDKDPKKSTGDILFFLHGIGGSETTFSTAQRHQALRTSLQHSGRLPTIITISFGPAWLVTNIPTAKHPALMPFVLMDAIPALEKKVGGLRGGRRLLMGESMGGMNAAMLSLAAPTTFSKVALVCPALFTVGPYSTQEEVEAYIARHQPYILRDKVEQANALGAEEFPTAELYDQHNPILWAQRTQNGFPPYYISMNTRDEYGVHEGASVFADMLRMRGQDPTFVAIVGLGHCYPTPDSIAALTKYLATP